MTDSLPPGNPTLTNKQSTEVRKSPSIVLRSPANREFVYLFVVVLILGFGMAWLSAFSSHPDELSHVKAADYYAHHWLPPRVGDPEARDSYSLQGFSYLDEADVVYFFAGKFGALLTAAGMQGYHAYRLINLLLFVGLIIVWLRREDSRLAFSLLLISPQIWYVFSYFNADAFPLFLSLLIAHQLASVDSLFNRYLSADSVTGHYRGALLMGLLVGLLLLSKRNYYVFLLFVPFYLVLVRLGLAATAMLFIAAGVIVMDTFITPLPRWMYLATVAITVVYAWQRWQRETNRRSIAVWAVRLLAVAALAAAIAVPRYTLDLIRYGSFQAKNDARLMYAEQITDDQFKPSKLGIPGESYYGSRLKAKGVSYIEIFLPPWNWLLVSAATSVGIYGYMSVQSPTGYYLIMLLALVAMLYYVSRKLIREGGPEARRLLGLVGVFSLAMIFLSSYHSWINDFQAQGRYLFPILGMLAVAVGRYSSLFNTQLYGGFVVVLFLLSIFSFVFTGLAHIPKA